MGLNLFEGLRAASQSFGQLANYQQKEDQESTDQLRQENLLRLRNQLDTEHDVKLEGMKNAQTDKNQTNYMDRLTLMQAEQDNRLDRRTADSDKRQQAALAASESRQQNQLDTTMELSTRKDLANQAQRAATERQRAVDDIGKIKGRMAAYLKQQAPLSGLDPDNPTSIVELAKKDPQALSYFQDLRDADNRRRQADQYLQGLPGKFGPTQSSAPLPSFGTGLIPNDLSSFSPDDGTGNGAP